jgi:hypothetical protein
LMLKDKLSIENSVNVGVSTIPIWYIKWNYKRVLLWIKQKPE